MEYFPRIPKTEEQIIIEIMKTLEADKETARLTKIAKERLDAENNKKE